MKLRPSKSNGCSKQFVISEELLAALKQDIDFRRIEDGRNELTRFAEVLETFTPSLPNAARFLGVIAEWCDIGVGTCEVVKRLISSYDAVQLSTVTIGDYVHLEMSKALVAMKHELPGNAISHLDLVLSLAGEFEFTDVLIVAHHWKARCLKKKGHYEIALQHLREARKLQLAHGHPQNAAPALVLESSILFEMGEPEIALNNLRDAESILSRTDDHAMLGRVHSTYGRILQSQQRYAQAIEHFEQAIKLFKTRELENHDVARATVDMALARIHVARHLRQKIEASMEHQAQNGRSTSVRSALVKEFSNLCEVILADLARAGSIYEKCPNVRGLAEMHLGRGYLYLETGKLDLSADEALRSYSFAKSRQDFIAMASARTLQCMVENARVDEEVDGWAERALAARDYACDAVELASNTQDRRLLAKVHIWQGLTLSNPFFNNREPAREAMNQAAKHLETGLQDRNWEDFQLLKRRLMENADLEPSLMKWAHGETGNKTFRQLEQDFADLVVPRVWAQENRKVSRVATRLSISPRKVRGVLLRLGLLDADKSVRRKKPLKIKQQGKSGDGKVDRRPRVAELPYVRSRNR